MAVIVGGNKVRSKVGKVGWLVGGLVVRKHPNNIACGLVGGQNSPGGWWV